MHVLILAQYYPPDIGGSSTRAYNVARGLVLNGVETTVITAFPHYPSGEIPSAYHRCLYKDESHDGVRVIRTFMVPVESKGLQRRLLTFTTFILSSLIGIFFIRGVDAIWVANPDIFGMIPGLFYKFRFRCPLVFNVDDLSIEDVGNLNIISEKSTLYRIAKTLSRFLYKRADSVTSISPGYYDGIESFGVRKNRIHLVRSGVDIDTFVVKKKHVEETFKIAYSGSFSVAYDFDQILKAMELIKNEPIEFIIQGKGEQGPKLMKRINELGLSNVKLFDIILSRQEVADFLGKADALILPLKDFGVPYPGISSKLYEYQALQKPIICCSEGQSAQYVEETGSGIIVKPGDYWALADAVRFLKEHPMEALEFGYNGRCYVEKHMGIDKIGLEMKQVLIETIEVNQT